MTTAKRPGPARGRKVAGSSSGSRGSRNHQASIGTGKSVDRRPACRRAADQRPSHATTRSARISPVPPSSVRYRTPRTRPPSWIELGHLGPHPEREGGLLPAGVGEQVEQVPLRHHGDVPIGHAQPAEVRDDDLATVADGEGDLLDPAVRQLGEPIGQTQLVEQLQRRRMNRVAAEVTQEVGVLLQHGDLDARPCEQEAQHHARGPAADDDAAGALAHRAP